MHGDSENPDNSIELFRIGIAASILGDDDNNGETGRSDGCAPAFSLPFATGSSLADGASQAVGLEGMMRMYGRELNEGMIVVD
eukprot:CAMPEP_0183710816 /NCGR_PEP_ID=MMETSP0737-20130205/6456_1 /TAXON_ID=385413 /ORGANISM="Thalassiosira miniscula, Strain CCMP1093" /LENGTH=82 /DNA_ID=CAMNT_0025939161 /DNA_START=363 /DNA_END=611 /DNA_ORIENTATION=+